MPPVRMSPRVTTSLCIASLGLTAALVVGCDDKPAKTEAPEAAAALTATATASAPPEPPRAPDIVIDPTTIAVGQDRVGTGEMGLADKVAVFVTGRPMIAGQIVSVVAMRNAKPGAVLAVVTALARAKAVSAILKTDTRDGVTATLPVDFAASGGPDCATVAWIAKDAAIEVWAAGGGAVKKVGKGLAGPDMTLGGDAVRAQQSGCAARDMFVGADERMTWGLVFDLANNTLTAPGARASAVVLLDNPAPGKKVGKP